MDDEDIMEANSALDIKIKNDSKKGKKGKKGVKKKGGRR